MTTRRLLTTFAALWLSLSVTHGADVFTPGFLKREFFAGQTRQAVLDGTAGAATSTNALSSFEAPTNVADNYAQRVSGYYVPGATGDYVFFLAADDDTDLFLSTDDQPANKKLIAQEAGWSGVRMWLTIGGASTPEDKRSDLFAGSLWPTPNTITLTNNQRYYIEAVHHEGTGGDNLAVYIKKAADPDPVDGDAPSTAGGSYGFFAAPATITFTTQPQSQTIVEGKIGTLTVAATTTSAYGISSYQWKSNGVAIAGATSSTFNLPIQSLANTGVSYTVDVAAAGAGTNTSAAATITVVADTVPPNLVSAGSLKTFTGGSEVGLLFDEALNGSTSTNLSNYTINNGAAITAARYVTNSSGLNSLQQGVILTVTGVTPGSSYTVTANGVSDLKGNAMTTAQSTNFVASNFSWISIGATTNGVNDAIAVGTNGFNVVNGGLAFWGTTDDITMVYEPVTGDFDRQAQVEWNDPSSNWARAGISARESLNNGEPTTAAGEANPASRYQMILADPMTKFDGTPANRMFETNRRVNEGEATSSITGGSGGTPTYPDVWVRLKRVGQRLSTFYSSDGQTWRTLGTTDFGDEAVTSGGPLTNSLFVGPTLGVENGNITGQGGTAEQQGAFAARFRNYRTTAQGPEGTQAYSVGLNFGADEGGGQLSTNDVAGVPTVAQANWNNIVGIDVAGLTGIVAEQGTAVTNTPITVDVTGSPNTWASQGPRGEQNNMLAGNDGILTTGYLDTGDASTTQVRISGIPSALTSAGYDVVVYALSGVANRGGSYRVTDDAGAVLAGYVALNAPTNPTNYVQVSTNSTNGNFIVFTNLKATNIVVEATTEGGLGTGGTPRAPINAIQLVSPTGLAGGGGSGGGPSASINLSGTNSVTITSSGGGTVQATSSLSPMNWQDIGPAPQTVPTTNSARFFRIRM